MKFAFWKYPIHFLALGFGTGLSPVAPGTVGSLIGVAFFWYMAGLPVAAYTAILVVLAVVGIWICDQTARDYQATDPGFIVWDEIVGFLVAMYLMPRSWYWILAGFIIYRIFDIWKPYPIHEAEGGLGLGGGIMADDIIAGIYTVVILHIARTAVERFS